MSDVSHQTLEDRLEKLATVAYWRDAPSARLRSLEGLRAFLVETALPLELRSVNDAFYAVEKGGVDVICGIESELAAASLPEGVAAAQKTAGRRALARLSPLVDEGLIQKYRADVNAGRMQGWGPIVFGLELRAFSIPLAQGLMHYGVSVVEAAVNSEAMPGRRLDTLALEVRDSAIARAREIAVALVRERSNWGII